MTNIQWTNQSDNPVKVVGGGYWCEKVSPGCKNCYAETINNNSFFGGNKLPYQGNPPELYLDEELISSWQRQRKPKLHFVSSMTDIFGEWIPLDWQQKILKGMWDAQLKSGQLFQILTKRPEVAAISCRKFMIDYKLKKMPINTWIGVSIENKKYLERSNILAQTPCNRFWSCEPLLEDLGDIKSRIYKDDIKWVIVGGESGKNARVFCTQWAENIISQCQELNIPVFVKQLGSDPIKPLCNSRLVSYLEINLKDKKGGDWDEWDENLKIREFPEWY